MKPRLVTVVGFGMVMALGVESLNPAHKVYVLPEQHSEIPAPTITVTVMSYVTTNTSAQTVTFVDGASGK